MHLLFKTSTDKLRNVEVVGTRKKLRHMNGSRKAIGHYGKPEYQF